MISIFSLYFYFSYCWYLVFNFLWFQFLFLFICCLYPVLRGFPKFARLNEYHLNSIKGGWFMCSPLMFTSLPVQSISINTFTDLLGSVLKIVSQTDSFYNINQNTFCQTGSWIVLTSHFFCFTRSSLMEEQGEGRYETALTAMEQLLDTIIKGMYKQKNWRK